MMTNQVPGNLGLKITTPFDLVHNAKPDYKTWFELFSIGYSNNQVDNTDSIPKLQAHTLDIISVGRDDKSNSINFITISIPVTITPLISVWMNQDPPQLISQITSALMDELPAVYFETRHTQLKIPPCQVPAYQFNINICYFEAPSKIFHFQYQKS